MYNPGAICVGNNNAISINVLARILFDRHSAPVGNGLLTQHLKRIHHFRSNLFQQAEAR